MISDGIYHENKLINGYNYLSYQLRRCNWVPACSCHIRRVMTFFAVMELWFFVSGLKNKMVNEKSENQTILTICFILNGISLILGNSRVLTVKKLKNSTYHIHSRDPFPIPIPNDPVDLKKTNFNLGFIISNTVFEIQ